MVSLRSRSPFHALGVLLLLLALVSCGSDGGSQQAPVTLDQTIISRYGSSPTLLPYANAVGIASTTLLQANVPDAASAKRALLQFSSSINCTKLPVSEAGPVQTDVMSLIFDTPERRAKLQDVYLKAGAFEIDPSEVQEGPSC